ncbi:MAG: S-methyl-5-thioribose-1-phosphate isomerase [Chloroflexi bacterium]|nr:S-methyl-5-thioribose-1-phosphate isomerase [Chloroflexota bacterium]
MNETARVQPIEWLGDRVRILDQTLLPGRIEYIDTGDYRVVADAIRRLCVRGAPAIGVAGAYGAALGALALKNGDSDTFLKEFNSILGFLASTRPTAVNLSWALSRVEAAARRPRTIPEIKEAVVAEAQAIQRHEEEATDRLSRYGADLIGDGFTVLTHCNAGSLATCGCGTALGVIKAAKAQGKKLHVFATETRPLLQGARLTAWELVQERIPVTLITDSMAGHFLSKGTIDAVVVGADRVAANGDVANKIGTYSIAVLAGENGVPFYVAAPLSTIDLAINSGKDIPIEERNHAEVTHIAGVRLAAEGVEVANPAFDVTPAKHVSAIITERGVVRPPYSPRLERLFGPELETKA